MEPVAGPTVAAKFATFDAAMATYVTDSQAFSVEAAAHSLAFQTAESGIYGAACTFNSDCFTSNQANFPGHCNIYYQHGQCVVVDLFPVVGPIEPSTPTFSCADFTCSGTNYVCAQDNTTKGIACVLSRCSGKTL